MGALDGARCPSSPARAAASAASMRCCSPRKAPALIVNDLGGANDGSGTNATPAQQVVDEIKALGGTAFANTDNISTWAGRESPRRAGRRRSSAGSTVSSTTRASCATASSPDLSEQAWDDVLSPVHLKGHFAVLRHAAEYWKHPSRRPARR